MCGKQRSYKRRFLEVWQAKGLPAILSDLWQILGLAAFRKGFGAWVGRMAESAQEPSHVERLEQEAIVGQ